MVKAKSSKITLNSLRETNPFLSLSNPLKACTRKMELEISSMHFWIDFAKVRPATYSLNLKKENYISRISPLQDHSIDFQLLIIVSYGLVHELD